MAISDDFKQCVEQNDLLGVRICLKSHLTLDPTGRLFDENFAYASARMPELLMEHDGDTFEPEEKWNYDYMNLQLVYLVNCFSKERIAHLKEVIRKVYNAPESAAAQPRPAAQTRPAAAQTGTSAAQPRPVPGGMRSTGSYVGTRSTGSYGGTRSTGSYGGRRGRTNSNASSTAMLVGAGAAIVGAGLLIGGIATSKAALAVIGGIALIAGGAAIVLNRK